MAGKRFNTGKPMIGSVSPSFLIGMGTVLTKGAEKYGRNNWMKGLSFTETLDSLERHVAALKAGEFNDAESGVQHAYHIGVNAMFLAHFLENYSLYQEFDDRAYTLNGVFNAKHGSLDSDVGS